MVIGMCVEGKCLLAHDIRDMAASWVVKGRLRSALMDRGFVYGKKS